MSKVTVTHVTNLTNQTSAVNTINADVDTLAAAFDNTLSLDGTSPNQMEAPLDMNSNPIINLPWAITAGEAVPYDQAVNLVAGLVSQQVAATTITVTGALAKNTDVNFTGVTLSNLMFLRWEQSLGAWTATITADLPTTSETVAGAIMLDRSKAEVHQLTLSANVALTVNNWGASGQMSRVVLQITNPSTFSITAWPVNTIWPAGIPPVITANGRDLIVLTTFDGGATIYGNVAGQNYS